MQARIKMSAQKRTTYATGLELKVITFIQQFNNVMAARDFSVNEKQVRQRKKGKKTQADNAHIVVKIHPQEICF